MRSGVLPSHMGSKGTPRELSQCVNCGFEAAAGGSEWRRVDSPPLGTLTQCPECRSTNVLSGRGASTDR